MNDDLKEQFRDVVADDELFSLLAKGMRKLHSALIAEGFSEAEATQIIAGQGMGAKVS